MAVKRRQKKDVPHELYRVTTISPAVNYTLTGHVLTKFSSWISGIWIPLHILRYNNTQCV